MNLQVLERIITDHPQFKFHEAGHFSWKPTEDTVTYCLNTPGAELLLLHELAHAILGHLSALSDVELLQLESQAWKHVKTRLVPKYGLEFDEKLAVEHMDTYRDWLHKRSLCPKCDINGWQTAKDHYKCPSCLATWRVNTAKLKRIRRTLTKK